MRRFEVENAIIEAYLQDKDLSVFQEDPLFCSHDNKKSYFEYPGNNLKDIIKLINDHICHSLTNLEFLDEDKLKKYFSSKEIDEVPITFRLVVGLPSDIKKMFTHYQGLETAIVFDLYNYANTNAQIDEIIEDIEDYARYAVAFLLIDNNIDTNNIDSITLFEHSIFSASYAYYISDSKQIDYMKNADVYDMWSYIEFMAILRVVRKKDTYQARDYIESTIEANPEMIVLGVVGKTFLSNIDDEDAYKYYQAGSHAFINRLSKNKIIKEKNITTAIYIILRILIPVVVIGVIIWGIFEISIKSISNTTKALQIMPLLIIMITCLKEYLSFRINNSSRIRLFIYLLVGIIISLIYLIIVI